MLSQSCHEIQHSSTPLSPSFLDECSLSPTTVIIRPDCIVSEGRAKVLKVPPHPKCSRPTYRQWLHYSITEHQDRSHIQLKIQTGNINTVSDGSYNCHLHLGTAAWLILDKDFNPLVSGTSVTPGSKGSLSAFCSKAIGTLAILDYIRDLCTTEDIQSGLLIMFCDNEKVLQIIDEWTCDRLNPKKKNADVLSALLLTRDLLPIRIETQHVKAHQDNKSPLHLLSPEAQVNVEMDLRAKELLSTLHTCPSPKPTISSHPLSFPACKWNNKTIDHNVSNQLYYEITRKNIINYWIERKQITLKSVDKIDFECMQLSSKIMPLYLKRFMTKWSVECLATGKNMKRWAMHHKGYCPFCTHHTEDTNHILLCQDAQALKMWNKNLDTLFSKLGKLQTCPQLLYAMREDLTAWRSHQPYPAVDEYPLTVQAAVLNQCIIGWKQFCKGIVSQSWSEHMTTYYAAKGNFPSSDTWKKKFGKMVWEFTYSVWEERNSQLHKTQHIKDMEGSAALKEAIKAEWQQELGSLPASEFSSLLSSTLPDLLNHSTAYLKQ